jgi:hypothetical protein
MVFSIVIKPIVFIDVEETVIFYEKESHGLGERFYKSFLQSAEDIRLSPQNYSYIYKPVRRHITKNFPYKVYYIVLNEPIVVIGVAHAKRSNRYIKSKLKYR